jgi:peptidoglycan/LPS O-acetylase OafA/YrhL
VTRFHYIDGLRGLLALWVLFGHVLAAAGLGQDWTGLFNIMANGVNAVDVFVIISGLVITHLLETAHENYRLFVWRRFLRIYPVYVICLLASAFLLPLAITVTTQTPWQTATHHVMVQIATDSTGQLPYHLLAHLALLHSVIPDSVLMYSDYAILGQAWSLSLEWQFYLIAPLILVALRRSVVTAGAVILVMTLLHASVTGVQGCLPRHIPYFALGIASYYLIRQPWRPAWPLLVPAGVALTYLCTHNAALVIWSAVFLLAFQRDTAPQGAILAVLETGPLRWLGKISYSVYLSHSIVITMMLWVLYQTGAAAFGQIAFFLFLLAMTLAGTLLLSSLLYRFVEAPAVAFGKAKGAPANEFNAPLAQPGIAARR